MVSEKSSSKQTWKRDKFSTGTRITKKGDAGWISKLQCFTVFAEILRATHKASESFEDAHRPGVDLGPGALEPVDGCCAEGGNNGCQGREIVQ